MFGFSQVSSREDTEGPACVPGLLHSVVDVANPASLRERAGSQS